MSKSEGETRGQWLPFRNRWTSTIGVINVCDMFKLWSEGVLCFSMPITRDWKGSIGVICFIHVGRKFINSKIGSNSSYQGLISFNCTYLLPNNPLRWVNGDHRRISGIDRRQQVETRFLHHLKLILYKFEAEC